MKKFYLDQQLAEHFGVPYFEPGSIIVALSTLRAAREWDERHERIWDTHREADVMGVHRQGDAPGWFVLVSS
jgi:hypothetical protein